MISPKTFTTILSKNDVDFYSGVPDSLLKDFCAYVSDTKKPSSHVTAANEGNAIALAAGYHIATRKFGLVYMQNSGLGNSVNPLVSLVDPDVYSIPVLMLVGWRGEPGKKDEPQHITQGKITLQMLKTMGIAHEVLPQTEAGAKKAVKKAVAYMKKTNAPYALVVKKGTFSTYKQKKASQTPIKSTMMREQVIERIASELKGDEIIISTTGKTSRELFEIREANASGHEKDFLKVGSMGHSSQIALGIALAKPKREVYCIDGDGAVLMHMGSLGAVGNAMPKNFKHIVLNNFVHESVGGQPTVAPKIDFGSVALACGYIKIFHAHDLKGLQRALVNFKKSKGPALLEVIIKQGSREDLGRPTLSMKENKKQFMDYVEKGQQAFTSPEKLKKFLKSKKAKNIFLVTGKKSYKKSGAQKMFKDVLSDYKVSNFSDFSPNPKLEEIKEGIKNIKKGKYDVIVAIGGGSAIDTAKIINFKSLKKPLVAIPTTSGSGSEATHFAVAYKGTEKYSLSHESVLPDLSIIEPALTMSMSSKLTAITGMDALAQAIEAYWSVHSTEESKRYSSTAIKLILDNLIKSVNNRTIQTREAMARASYLAGKAINITKTTAPHALSYFLTARFNIPHGHAVALTLAPIFDYNSNKELKNLISSKNIRDIMKSIGLETKLSSLGVQKSDISDIAQAVNIERLKNNPRKLNKKNLTKILHSVL